VNPVEAAEYCAEYDAQIGQLQHVTNELARQVENPRDLATIEEAYSIAHRALHTLARVAAMTPDRPPLRVVR
jgi:hypothetical protein